MFLSIIFLFFVVPYPTRSEREFLYQILGEVIKAGATTLNIPDTVGYNVPEEYSQLIADIKSNTPGIDNVIISTHCQNDLGLSTANTLAVCICLCFGVLIRLLLNNTMHSHLISSMFRGHVQVLGNWK